MAANDKSFVDYYEMLRVSPGAELESIQRVHRALAARYHPDNKETGNLERFLKVNEAFKVLSDPEKRKDFDSSYKSRKENPLPVFLTKEFTVDRGNGPETLVAVYVPTNHLYIGDIVVCERARATFPEMTVEEGIRIFLTGGMALPSRLKATPGDNHPKDFRV